MLVSVVVTGRAAPDLLHELLQLSGAGVMMCSNTLVIPG